MSRWRKPGWLAAVLVLALLVAGLIFWARSRSAPEAYQTVVAERGDLIVTVSANGTLNPVKLVSVGTQVSGTVRRLHADFNARVTQGQVLLELDDSTYAAAVRQSEANLQSVIAQAELAAANAARSEGLYTKGYLSQADVDQVRQAARSATAQRDLVRAQVDRDRANLGYTVIRSPVSGVVVSREVDVGQTVAASFQTPTLFKIAQDLAKMQIDSNFAEADVGRIKAGEAVRFTVDAFPERTFTGQVSQVRLNPQTIQNVVTYDVVVAVENPEEILLPGMTAYVNVVLAERSGVLRIPNSALRFRPPGVEPAGPVGQAAAVGAAPATGRAPLAGGAARGGGAGRPGRSKPGAARSVYVLRDGKPVAVRVELGGTDRRYTEVVSGELRDGDRVVIGLAGGAAGAPGGAPRMRMF